MLRVVVVVAGLVSSLPAIGGEMTASEARHFVVGKLFSYTCFDGTHRSARVRSVDGSIQFQSAGLNLVLLTPLWTRTAHVVPLRMVRCRFPKLRYG